MLQYIYISTARSGRSEGELDLILKVSRRRNAAIGITGLLVAGGNRFLQVLEGPEAALLSTIERIERDHRHFGIVTLAKRPIQNRAFGSWAMGFERSAAGHIEGDLTEIVAELIHGVTDKNLQAQFTGFAGIHSRAA